MTFLKTHQLYLKCFALFITEVHKRHAYIFFQLVELSRRGDVNICK